MTVLIGTSGWHYRDWRGGFYPEQLRTVDWLGHYSSRFETVELNNAFYRLPDTSTFEGWAATVPDGFVVAVKASRYLTHVKRLRDPAEPVARLMERARGLGPHLGPVLLQLPPNLKADPAALDATLSRFPAGTRVAVEARHPTWFTTQVRSVLERRQAAWCLADGGVVQPPDWVTADWSYVRFHRGRARPDSCYGRTALQRWAERLAAACGHRTVYCYFNNDPHGCAPRDARLFANALGRVGLVTSRVPTARETPVHTG